MNSIQTIVHNSRTTLVRIGTLLKPNTHIIQCPTITVDPPSIRGLNSIRQDLSRLEAQLKELAYGPLAQIQTDVSSLNGFVGNLAEPLNCVLDLPARAGEGRASGRFCERCVCESLKKVQVYLDELVLNVDQLGAC